MSTEGWDEGWDVSGRELLDPDGILRSSLSERAKHGRSGSEKVLGLLKVVGGCDSHV